jgi:predicted  nucleic acid-binding Zn-ribbon protein
MITVLRLITVSVVLGREEPEGGSPIDSVVGLIEEMQKKIEADGVAEQAVFDKYACWCEETTSRKSQNIGFAQTEIQRLGVLVLNQKGTAAVKDYEMNVLKKQIKENQDATNQATIIRQKDNTAFQSKKAEMETTIGSLEKGIMVLSGAGTHTASLIAQKGMMSQMKASIKKAVRSLPADGDFSPDHMEAITKFLQDPAEFYDQKAAAKEAYSPASTTIMGILKDMYDTFAKNLESETSTESTAQMAFEDLMATKTKELATLNAELKIRSAEHAEALVQVADASQELDDTTQQMKADIDFFDDAKAQCSAKADAWAERVRARTEELAGISKAIEILTSDDAKALFGKAIKPGMEKTFLQISSEVSTTRKGKAYSNLKKLAQKTKSTRIASIAAKLRMTSEGHFDLVIEEIDVLIKQLKEEEHDDIVHRDWCKDETFKNEQEVARYEYKIRKTEAHEVRLKAELEELESVLEKTVDEIKNTNEEIKLMEDERVAEHQEFLQAKSDDEGAVALLKSAIESLSAFYRNNPPAAALLQGKEDPKFGDEDTPPDSEMSDANKSSGENKGIVAILEMLQEDLEAEISNGVKKESEAHGDFENAMKKAKNVLKALLDKKSNLKQSILETNSNIDDKQKDITDLNGLLTDEKDYLAEIKPDCDWILSEFAGRRAKRTEEMEGLVDGKAMLAGASPEGLIQTGAFMKKH